VIWIWDEDNACCQPSQPLGKQVPPADAKPRSAAKSPQTTVLRPPTKPSVPKEVAKPNPPPAPPPSKPPVPKRVEAAPPAAKPELKDIEVTLKAKGGFEKLLAAAKVAGALEELAGGGPFTVFAPTDEAFAKLDPLVLERLMADPDKLNDLLLYHSFAGKLTADEALQRGSVKTIQGSNMQFRRDGARRLVNDAEVTEADIACTNGVVQVIDRVLFPQRFELPAAGGLAKPPAGAAATKPAAEGPPSEPKSQ
jgi:uncharacterized surface protein with fasciclin (FAS1) repeats